MPDSIRWYATLLALTWCFAPLARLAAGRLPSRGAFLAKPLGLLITVWPIWFLSSVSPFPYATWALWAAAVLGGVAGWALLLRRGRVERDWLVHLLVAEAIALVAYVGLIGLRGYTPQIAGTEKPMDMALLTSSARATDMPPADPWMSGETINYYYLGYVLHGSLARLSGVTTWVGYNLALATTFAMTVTVAAGLGYDLVRARLGRGLAAAAGTLAAFLVVIAGNLRAPIEFLKDPGGVWHAFWWQSIGWQASRVVVDTGSPTPDTINEFPSFSFILGDLHPHVMALPFTLVSLTIAMALLRGARFWGLGSGFDAGAGERETDNARNTEAVIDAAVSSSPEPSPQPSEPRRFPLPSSQSLIPLVLAGLVIGALYPLNSWDYPTYLGAAAVALLFAVGWSRDAIARTAVLGVASIVAWAPFWLDFVPFAGGSRTDTSGLAGVPVLGRIAETVAGYNGERTSAAEFLTVFGVPWAIGIALLAVEAARSVGGRPVRVPKWAVAAVIVLAIVALGLPAPVLILAGLPLAVAVWLIERRDPDEPERTVIATLLAAGFALILLTEFFYIQDVFNGRFNTLFKVYYQVWTLFGIASAVALVRLWRLAAANRGLQAAIGAAVVLVVLLGTAYPVISAKTWTEWQGPRAWQGLDGADYIATMQPDDLAAIGWLRANAEDDDVVLELPGCSYEVNGGVPTSRVSAFSGVPTVIGWTGHEGQWRGGQPDLLSSIEARRDATQQMYVNPQDTAELDRYGVTLLFVGTFEREGTNDPRCPNGPYETVNDPSYPGSGWTQVYAQGDVRIYRRTA